jgi:hypothetical protein
VLPSIVLIVILNKSAIDILCSIKSMYHVSCSFVNDVRLKKEKEK